LAQAVINVETKSLSPRSGALNLARPFEAGKKNEKASVALATRDTHSSVAKATQSPRIGHPGLERPG